MARRKWKKPDPVEVAREDEEADVFAREMMHGASVDDAIRRAKKAGQDFGPSSFQKAVQDE